MLSRLSYRDMEKRSNNINYQKALVDNKVSLRFSLENIEIVKSIYKNGTEEYLIDLVIEKDDKNYKVFDKFKQKTLDHVFQRFKGKFKREKLEERYTFFTTEEDTIRITLEINNYYSFESVDEFNKKQLITFKELMDGDIAEVEIEYYGIKYTKKTFTDKFFVFKITKNIETEQVFAECAIETDESDDETDEESINFEQLEYIDNLIESNKLNNLLS